jgi:hypothetical protein
VAALAAALADRWTLDDAVVLANRAAALSVGKFGTATVSAAEIGLDGAAAVLRQRRVCLRRPAHRGGTHRQAGGRAAAASGTFVQRRHGGADGDCQRLRLQRGVCAADRGPGPAGRLRVAISTSGRSPNVLRGLQAAKATGLCTVGLLGRDGGAAADLCDVAVVVSHVDSARVQEAHIFIGHTWCGQIESALGLA